MNFQMHSVIKYIAGLIFFFLMSTGNAGDEDMNPTAYQRFDPETGFMIPIQPHEGQQQSSSQTTQGTAGVAQSPDTSAPSAATGTTESKLFWVYLLAGVTLLAGLAAWVRSKRIKTTPSHLD